MPFLSLLTALGATSALAYLATPLTIRLASRIGAVDVPGPRKVHSRPVGRLGGLAVAAAAAACYSCALATTWPVRLTPLSSLSWGLGLGLLPILTVSLIDDIRGVRVSVKLAAHLIGAGILVYWGVKLQPVVHLLGYRIALGVAAVPLSVLWLVGVTNAFNIIDGLDGLSAGLALISSASLTGVFLISGQLEMAFVSAVLCAALVGFLPFNLYPARVFLGDTGATTLGFTVACFALKGSTTLSAGFAVMLPVVLIGIPILDTLVAVVRRATKRIVVGRTVHVFEADREHIHHRLLALGVRHRMAVLTLFAAALVLAALSLLSILMTTVEAGLLLTAVLIGTFVGISRLGYEEFAFIRRGSVLKIYNIPILQRGFFAILVDFIFVGVSVYTAVGLKFDDWGLVARRTQYASMISVLAPSTLASFWAFGLYKRSWRFAGVGEFRKLSVAVLVSAVSGYFAFVFLTHDDSAASIFAIYAMLQLCIVNASRASYRILKDQQVRSVRKGTPTLIYGAGDRGARILRELLANDHLGLQPVGFIDDNPLLTGKDVNGVSVMGGVLLLEQVVNRTGACVLVVSSSRIPADRALSVTRLCDALHVRIVRAEVRLEAMPFSRTDEPALA